MTPQKNLELQTRIIANARAFVGTYGGLSYVAPFYGVPSVGFYSQESDLMSAHLDVGWRLGRDMNAPLAALDAKNVELLRTLFGTAVPPANAGLRAVKAASAGPR
jgi:ADP-heptose:LPS heptosyltransferase